MLLNSFIFFYCLPYHIWINLNKTLFCNTNATVLLIVFSHKQVPNFNRGVFILKYLTFLDWLLSDDEVFSFFFSSFSNLPAQTHHITIYICVRMNTEKKDWSHIKGKIISNINNLFCFSINVRTGYRSHSLNVNIKLTYWLCRWRRTYNPINAGARADKTFF